MEFVKWLNMRSECFKRPTEVNFNPELKRHKGEELSYGFESLPDGVIRRIFLNLKPMEVYRLRLVSKRWNKIACTTLNSMFEVLCEQVYLWKLQKYKSTGMNKIQIELGFIKLKMLNFMQAGLTNCYPPKLINALDESIKMVQHVKKTSSSVLDLVKVLNELTNITDESIRHFESLPRPSYYSCQYFHHQILICKLQKVREAMRKSSTDILLDPQILQSRLFNKICEQKVHYDFDAGVSIQVKKQPTTSKYDHYNLSEKVRNRSKIKTLKKYHCNRETRVVEGTKCRPKMCCSDTESELEQRNQLLPSEPLQEQCFADDSTVRTQKSDSDCESFKTQNSDLHRNLREHFIELEKSLNDLINTSRRCDNDEDASNQELPENRRESVEIYPEINSYANSEKASQTNRELNKLQLMLPCQTRDSGMSSLLDQSFATIDATDIINVNCERASNELQEM